MAQNEGFGMRALYTQIQLPGNRHKGEDAQSYEDKVRASQNLLNQNFLTIQQQVGELTAAVLSLQEWASQFK